MKGVIEIGYEKEQIDELCSHLDLVEYVSRDYELKGNGDEFSMHCPCHKDSDPSMYLSKSKNSFYCHSCRRRGGPLQWLIQVEKLSFPQAIDKLTRETGIEVKHTETASSFKFFKSMAGIANKEEKRVEREILPESYLDQFQVPPDGEPKLWLDEGISQEMIRKYNIRIAKSSNRIVYPVYDNEDRLIGVKGRTMFENYKLLGISKYINLVPIKTTDFLQGMHENRTAILEKSEAILFEGIKSVMLADSWGYHNCVSTETSMINEAQARILIQMGIKDCVIAFDNDVPLKELKSSANRLGRWMNVWFVQDKNGNPGDKLAPVDKGEKIWKELYEGRVRYG